MSLPSTGQISLSAINTELGRASNAQISLGTASNGGYAAINQNSTSRPNGTDPDAMSEWRGYNHSAAPASYTITIWYDTANARVEADAASVIPTAVTINFGYWSTKGTHGNSSITLPANTITATSPLASVDYIDSATPNPTTYNGAAINVIIG